MRARVFGAAALSVFAMGSTAQADDRTWQDDAAWEASLTATGEPALAVWSAVPPSGRFEVFRCPAGGTCDAQPLATAPDDPKRIGVAGSAPGDVFEGRFFDADGTLVATHRTTAWTGTATVATPPSVVGTPTVSASVSASPGTWSGGWSAPWASTATSSLIACPTPAGTDCAFLTQFVPITLAARWAGWYLFARSTFSSGHTNLPALQALTPYGSPASITVGPLNTVSAPVGPIATPLAAPAKAPEASVRARALRAKGRLSVARVTCPASCSVKLTVSAAKMKTISRTLAVTGTQALTIAPRHGKLKVRVVVDGKSVATGTSVAR